MFEYVKGFCDSFLDRGMPGFDIEICKDTKRVFRYMNGYSDVENGVKMNGGERYNIYSCSKPITCTSALQLYEKGLFSLDDKLSCYMPEFENMTVQTPNGIKKAEKPILIKHLFEMTAGFTYDCRSELLQRAINDTDGKCPTRQTIGYLAGQPLSFEPGEKWQYSLCHDVLAALVEQISGRPFEDYVKENIFSPLGMDNSTFMLPEEQINTVCPLYRFENGKAQRVDNHIIPYKIGTQFASGGAGCVSTLDDYMKFINGLYSYKLLKKETVGLMSTDRLNNCIKDAYWHKDNHGYGLGVRCPAHNGNFSDFGWDGAAGAYLAIDIKNGITVFFACHLLSNPVQNMYPMLYRLIKAEMTDGNVQPVLDELKQLYNYAF